MRLRTMLALVGFTLASVPCFAQPSKSDLTEARRLFDEALVDEAADNWIGALEKLKGIVAIKETAGVRFHMAIAEERLGQLMAAKADYERSLSLVPALADDERADLEQRCERALKEIRARIPTVTITSAMTVPALRVLLDGQPLPAAQIKQPLAHEPGEVRVEASAPGYQPFSRVVVLPEGAAASIELVLAPIEAEHAESTAPAPASPEQGGGERPRISPLAYASGGVAIAAAGASVILVLNALRLRHETDEVCADPQVLACDSARETRIDQYWGGAAASGVLALGAASLAGYLVLSRSASSSAPSLAVSPSGVWLHGRF